MKSELLQAVLAQTGDPVVAVLFYDTIMVTDTFTILLKDPEMTDQLLGQWG